MSVISDYSELDEYVQDYYPEAYYYEETALDIWNDCVILSCLSVVPTLVNLIFSNFLFGCLLLTGWLPTTVLHLTGGFIGIYLILSTLESPNGKIILVCCWIVSFLLLHIGYYLKNYVSNAIFLKAVFIVLLILCEYYMIEPKTWLQIRGIVMVLVMKIISLADDVEKVNSMPGVVEYFGYTLCGANVLFGPWVSFSEYLIFCKKPAKKNLIWICAIVKILVTSLFFLTLSNCWAEYFVGEDSNRWLVAYKEAFSFRTSHYFISYLAEAGMIAAGFTAPDTKGSNSFRYVVTEPLEIEFPSSLSVVVKKWNQPMHEFLKKYVFYSWLPYGKLSAIFATFLASSFLHGFELKVSVVLVSIGIFSYLQVAPRDCIAEIFDCCVKIRPCKECKHKYKRDNIKVKIILLIYSFATVFHLAYLGVLMDPSTDEVGIYEKWQNLYFVSHIVMVFNVMIIL